MVLLVIIYDCSVLSSTITVFIPCLLTCLYSQAAFITLYEPRLDCSYGSSLIRGNSQTVSIPNSGGIGINVYVLLSCGFTGLVLGQVHIQRRLLVNAWVRKLAWELSLFTCMYEFRLPLIKSMCHMTSHLGVKERHQPLVFYIFSRNFMASITALRT